MGKESVFTLADGNAEPVARANGRLDLEQQLAADGKQASADAAYAAGPVLRNLVKLEGGVINEGLNRGDDVVGRIADADTASDRSHRRLCEADGQFPNRLGMKNAVRINRDDDFSIRMLQRVANRTSFAAVNFIASRPDPDVGEISLCLLHPFVAVVGGAVVLRDHFKLVIRIVA